MELKLARLLSNLLAKDHHHRCAATMAMMDAVVRADGDVMNIENVFDVFPHT
jgi:hypothetical protein